MSEPRRFVLTVVRDLKSFARRVDDMLYDCGDERWRDKALTDAERALIDAEMENVRRKMEQWL